MSALLPAYRLARSRGYTAQEAYLWARYLLTCSQDMARLRAIGALP